MSDKKDIPSELSKNIEGAIVEKVTGFAGDVLTGIPAPIRKNAFKAFAQLCTAVIDIPVAHFSGIAAEKNAETQARIKIINTGADQIANQMKMDPEYAQIAVKKYGQRIIREQINLDIISENAKQELLQLNVGANSNSDLHSQNEDLSEDISEDWLNTFEKEAANKSSDEMRILFGKILAGEISKPKSYSIKTVKIISQLDNHAAKLFQTFCSLAVSLQVGKHVVDGRVVSINGNAASNSLQKYGLSFDSLNILQEYGLIISDYNSYLDYSMCIAKNMKVSLSFTHQEKLFALALQNGKNVDNLKLSGVALSNSGKELLKVVNITPSSAYTNDLSKYFENRGLDMVEISSEQ